MKAGGFVHPLILQFTVRDPATLETVLITTNIQNSFKAGWDTETLLIRDITIQKDLVPTEVMAKEDKKKQIKSQLDMALRNLARDKLDHMHCYVKADKPMEWKNNKNQLSTLAVLQ